VAAALFSDEWARAWAAELNASDDFRVQAAKWEGVLVLAMDADPASGIPERRAVWVDLAKGTCRGARAASGEDLEQTPILLSGPAAVWDQILYGQLEPAMAVTMGLLTLSRGALRDLVPFIPAAKQLLLAAARVETDLPEGWEKPGAGSREPGADSR